MTGEIGEFMHTSIDLDSAEAPHVSFFTMNDTHNLSLATLDSNQWAIQQILIENDFRGFASFELDANDHGHLAIQRNIITEKDNTDRALSYATDESGAWEIETLDISDEYEWDIGKSASLAVDADNAVHISYQRIGLLAITNAGGQWTEQGGDVCPQPEGSAGHFSSITTDADNQVHIAHGGCDANNSCLRYVTSVGGWHGECVPNSEYRSNQSAIAVDQLGEVYLAFIQTIEEEKKTRKLYIAIKSDDNWTIEGIDPNISFFCRELSDSYLGLDGDGNAHIAYTGLDDENNPVLKYATNASGEWVTEIVDPSPNSGIGASIAVDSEGYVHISYYDNGNSSLKYATNRP